MLESISTGLQSSLKFCWNYLPKEMARLVMLPLDATMKVRSSKARQIIAEVFTEGYKIEMSWRRRAGALRRFTCCLRRMSLRTPRPLDVVATWTENKNILLLVPWCLLRIAPVDGSISYLEMPQRIDSQTQDEGRTTNTSEQIWVIFNYQFQIFLRCCVLRRHFQLLDVELSATEMGLRNESAFCHRGLS